MKHVICLLVAIVILTSAHAQEVKRDIPYTKSADKLQTLDVYSPPGAKNLPVVFWIHGGGWQAGDKSEVYMKPQVFNAKGFILVSTNYRLLPKVDMATLTRDVAKSIRWVHDHIAEHGGDPKRLLIMGHSAGAQLAALLCTDERYLKEEGLSFAIIKGCVPVDGDTYDIPAMIEVAEMRQRLHGLALPKFGHRIKLGNDPAKHKDFSAVTHIRQGQGHSAVLDPVCRQPSGRDRAGPASGQRAEERRCRRHAFPGRKTRPTPGSTPISENRTTPPQQRCRVR